MEMVKDNSEIPSNARGAVLEDSIMHKGHPVTAGSRMLENFISPLDAAVVERLEAAGIAILGKTTMDEFGSSGLFESSHDYIIKSGESGAVSAVADGTADFALCNDYSGAVRQRAAARGLFYIRPTYGTVSRYGLIPAVPSMDQIGVVCRSAEDGARVLSIISGYDARDGAMVIERTEDKGQRTEMGAGVRAGVPGNVLGLVSDASGVDAFVKGFEVVRFDLKYFEVFGQVMQVLCCAELSSSICRYDGIKFGYRADGYGNLKELYTKSRTEAFGPDVKLAAIVGAMVLSQDYYDRYYDKAMRVRRLILESLDFDKYDVIVLPCFNVDLSNEPNTSSANRLLLALHALPQLCGLPAVTAPLGNGGVTLVARAGHEELLFSILQRGMIRS